MPLPILLPELGAGGHSLRISSWFVEPGDVVEAGDCLAEVLTGGMTCDVPTPIAGRITALEKEIDAVVQSADVLAWIEP